jgi:hypothetical protein
MQRVTRDVTSSHIRGGERLVHAQHRRAPAVSPRLADAAVVRGTDRVSPRT